MGEVKRKIANGAHNGSGGKGEKGEITLTAAEVVSAKTTEQPSRRWER